MQRRQSWEKTMNQVNLTNSMTNMGHWQRRNQKGVSMNGLKAKRKALRILEGTEEARRGCKKMKLQRGSVLTLWAAGLWECWFCGTMPSEGHRKDVGRKPVEGWKLRITGSWVHKKAADQKGWGPRILGIRGNALAKLAEIPESVRGQTS